MRLKKIKDLSEFNPIWLEEPLHPSKIDEYSKLKNKIPIAAGEAYSGFLEFDYLINNNSVDVYNLIVHSGGIDICKKKNSSMFHSNLHLALSLEDPMFFEVPHIEFELQIYGNQSS